MLWGAVKLLMAQALFRSGRLIVQVRQRAMAQLGLGRAGWVEPGVAAWPQIAGGLGDAWQARGVLRPIRKQDSPMQRFFPANR
jgi:hypothetical protein